MECLREVFKAARKRAEYELTGGDPNHWKKVAEHLRKLRESKGGSDLAESNYPTVWAYEQVCQANEEKRVRIAELEAALAAMEKS